MKIKTNNYLMMFGVVLMASLLFGKEASNPLPSSAKIMDALTTGPTQSVININNVAYWMKKSSAGTTSGSPNGTQADYPIGTGGLIYEDGMLWGTKVTDGNTQKVRVNGTTYYAGVKAGRVIYDSGGNVVGATDPSLHHVWRVRTDYMTADLTSDAANFLMESEPSATQIQDVYNQYSYDWTNWPAAWGAPYEDVDGDGAYDPTKDIPGYPGAAQTLWVVANDVPVIVDENGVATGDTLETSENIYGADPIGVELQVAMWAYKFAATNPLGNIVFKKARLKYTGLPAGYNNFDPTIAKLDTVYFTQWSDPDLGTYTDDYVGCDIDLGFGYVYNGNTLDGVFNGIYNLPVPAGGYDFLQGPENNLNLEFSEGTGEGAEMVAPAVLPMTAFTYFGAGSSISDPDFTYDGSLQFFNLMEGFLPRPKYPIQEPWTDLSTGEITKFVLSGDPVSGTGWVDGVQLPPGDRRLVMASGPFEMNLGDSQDVVLALIAGMGADAISSVTVAKYFDRSAQYAYDNVFDLPAPPTTPQVTAVETDGEIALDWGSFHATVSATELIVTKGFEFEGYNVYQIPSPTAPLSEGVRVATFDKVNLLKAIFDWGVDQNSGYVLQQVKQFGTDSGIQRFYTTDYDALRNRPMSNGITYHFAVSAYSFNKHASENDPFVTLESTPALISVTPHSENPGEDWLSETGGDVATTHIGTAGGSVTVTVANPEELTGNNYEVNFDLQHYYMDVDGFWKMTAYPDSIGTLGKTMDVSPSTLTGSALVASTIGTADLLFTVNVVSPDYNYAAGVKITLPPGIVINSASASGSIAALVSTDGTNSVMFGDTDVDGAGDFAGGEIVTINVDVATVNFPVDIGFTIYDDGWATLWCPDNPNTCIDYGIGPGFTETVNAEGIVTISELGYDFMTLKHWNLVNKTTGVTLLEDMTTLGGKTKGSIVDGVYDAGGISVGAPDMQTTEGFYVNTDVPYAAPLDAESITATGPNSPGRCVGFNQSGTVCDYNVDSYMGSGWETDATGVTTYGSGTSSVDLLQRDVSVVFDGVYGDPITTASGASYYPVVEGGSQAWVYSASSMADHPENTSGGSDPFLVTVPFKVYDLEAGDEPVQIGMIMRDRIQSYDGSDPTLYAFNPDDRMYTWFVNRPYAETLTDFASNEALLTWNVVWWNQQWVAGDQLTFVYGNPIQQGVDKWTFTTVQNTSSGSITQDEIDMINVYPNPYYGLHELEESRSEKYVSFNHLPQKATIRIFTMGGTMVREIKKDDSGQFTQWDLANQYGYPVASGLYIIHIETDYGEKILKLALVQETQVLKYY